VLFEILADLAFYCFVIAAFCLAMLPAAWYLEKTEEKDKE